MEKFTFKKLLLPLLLIISFNYSYADFYVVGYFPNWTSTNPASLPFSMVTHINYAFITPNSSGGLNGVSTKSDSTKLRTLVTNAHIYNVKVLISIGGAGGSGNFAKVTASAGIQSTFVNNVLKFVNVFNLDGVDMDWEFPTSETEAVACSQLMKQVSDSLHKYNKLSTMAVNPFGTYADYIKTDIFDNVDFLNIMAYDGGTPHSSLGLANQAMDYWVTQRGLAKEKAILGVPFYGRNSLGVVPYKTLVANDDLAPYKDQSDYVVNGTTYNTNYNGIQTIKSKTNLAKNEGGGIMIWELTNDTNDETSLLKAIRSLVPASIENSIDENSFAIYPNPTTNNFTLGISEKYKNESIRVSVLDITGKSLSETTLYNSLSGTINTSNLSNGCYFVNIQIGANSILKKLIIGQK